MTKINYIGADHFLLGKDIDFSSKFNELDDRVLHIHGEKDPAVPRESLNFKFSNQIIVKGGDHQMERPDLMEQWLPKAVDFLLGKR